MRASNQRKPWFVHHPDLDAPVEVDSAAHGIRYAHKRRLTNARVLPRVEA